MSNPQAAAPLSDISGRVQTVSCASRRARRRVVSGTGGGGRGASAQPIRRCAEYAQTERREPWAPTPVWLPARPSAATQEAPRREAGNQARRGPSGPSEAPCCICATEKSHWGQGPTTRPWERDKAEPQKPQRQSLLSARVLTSGPCHSQSSSETSGKQGPSRPAVPRSWPRGVKRHNRTLAPGLTDEHRTACGPGTKPSPSLLRALTKTTAHVGARVQVTCLSVTMDLARGGTSEGETPRLCSELQKPRDLSRQGVCFHEGWDPPELQRCGQSPEPAGRTGPGCRCPGEVSRPPPRQRGQKRPRLSAGPPAAPGETKQTPSAQTPEPLRRDHVNHGGRAQDHAAGPVCLVNDPGMTSHRQPSACMARV